MNTGEVAAKEYNKRKLGSEQEERAVTFLKENGYRILGRNFYCGYGEIDIICKDGDYIVFVEVKFRSSARMGMPAASISARKRAKIIASAKYYLYKNQLSEEIPIRFDVVEILGTKIRVIKGAFEA